MRDEYLEQGGLSETAGLGYKGRPHISAPSSIPNPYTNLVFFDIQWLGPR
jgi:hypothetical protein